MSQRDLVSRRSSGGAAGSSAAGSQRGFFASLNNSLNSLVESVRSGLEAEEFADEDEVDVVVEPIVEIPEQFEEAAQRQRERIHRSISHEQEAIQQKCSRAIRDLHVTSKDIIGIVEDPKTFHQMKQALRNKGCVTNTYLQQTMHHYVYNLKNKKQRKHHHRSSSQWQQHQSISRGLNAVA